MGAAVARRFAGAGHPVGLVARHPGRLEDLAQILTVDGVNVQACAADASDPAADV